MTTKCPKCNEEYEVEEELIGCELECSQCNNVFIAKQKSSLTLGKGRGHYPKDFDFEEEDDDYEESDQEFVEGICNSASNLLGKDIKEGEFLRPLLYLIGVAILSVPVSALVCYITSFLGWYFYPTLIIAICAIFSCNQAVSLFLASHILGHKDIQANDAISASIRVFWLGLPTPLFLLAFILWFSPGMVFILCAVPFANMILIPAFVYNSRFQKDLSKTFGLATLQAIFTIVLTTIISLIFSLLIMALAFIFNFSVAPSAWGDGGDCETETRDGLEYIIDTDELFTGEIESFYDDNSLMGKVNYKAGKLDGLEEYWHENGQLMYKGFSKKGESHGICKFWYKNGQLEAVGNMKNGIKTGIHKKYYRNGQMYKKWFYKNGIETKRVEVWYENGDKMPVLYDSELEIKGNLIYIKLSQKLFSGLQKDFYSDGSIKYKILVKDGKKHGEYVEYYENGEYKQSGSYKNGIKEKGFKYYDQDGKEISFKEFKKINKDK